jgi:hypothetical protein
MPPGGEYTRKRHQAANALKAELLRRVAAGDVLRDALDALDIKPNTYARARSRDREWASKVSAARGETLRDRKLTEADRRDPLRVANLTHEEWCAEYLNMVHRPSQLRIADALDRCEPGEIIMVNVWPGVGKSTSCLNWATKKLCRDPNHRIALVGASQDLTRKFVGRLENRFVDTANFQRMIDTFGPFKEDGRDGKPWSADHFRVAKATHDEADYSVQAYAWGSLAYGSRVDTLIIDDVQSRKTLSQTETILDNLRATWFTRDSASAALRIIIVGTRIGPGDVYEAFLEDGIVDQHIMLTAAGPDGEPTEPEFWERKGKGTPRENMERQRKLVREEGWFAGYQQNPIANEVSTFGMYIADALDHDRRYGELIAL